MDMEERLNGEEDLKKQMNVQEKTELQGAMEQMENEGGGVVPQNVPFGTPILRNDLVDLNNNNNPQTVQKNGD